MIRTLGLVVLTLLVSAHTLKADWPFRAKDGIRRGSPEYYEARSGDPAGGRQVYKAGKMWPPMPRPTGPEQTFIHKYHSNHYWPMPYVCDDRAALRSFIDTQAANGWANESTFFAHHFNEDNDDLSSAGYQHLFWILHSVPTQQQRVILSSSTDPQIDMERTRRLESALAKMVPPDVNLNVELKFDTPYGRPGVEVQQIFTKGREGAPAPILVIKEKE